MTTTRRAVVGFLFLIGSVLVWPGMAWAQAPTLTVFAPPNLSGLPGINEADDACLGGEIYDDGVPEAGISGGAGLLDTYEVVQQFNPTSLAKFYAKVCVNLLSAGAPSHDFEIVVYSSDGGVPGTQLGATPVTAGDLPSRLPGRWYSFDVTGVAGFTTTAPVFIGIRTRPTEQEWLFLQADRSAGTPVHPAFNNTHQGAGWTSMQLSPNNFNAMLIRAVPAVPVPTLSAFAYVATLILLGIVALYGMRQRRSEPAFRA